MAEQDNRYTRFVQLAKITLPLAALGLLSTMFLLTRTVDPTLGIDYADFDVEEVAREQRVAQPKFSGVTEDGSEVYMTAASATPDPQNPRRFLAQAVDATINATSGMTYNVLANAADYDGTDESLVLNGDVVVTTSTGYQLKTERLITNISETQLESPGEVNGAGPEGTLRADSMTLETRGEAQVLVFKGRVKLIYQPEE